MMTNRLSIRCLDNVRGIELCLKDMKNPISIFSQVAIYRPFNSKNNAGKHALKFLKQDLSPHSRYQTRRVVYSRSNTKMAYAKFFMVMVRSNP